MSNPKHVSAKAPTLSMKFSQMKLPGIAEPPEIQGPIHEPHRAFLPGLEQERPKQKAPVPTIARQSEFVKEFKKVHRHMDAGDGMPRKALLKIYKGHTSPITSIDVGLIQSREFLFSGSLDCSARMFNIATAQCLHIFEGHTGAVTAVCMRHILGESFLSEQSRYIEQSLEPVWGDPKQDKWVFDLEHMYKEVSFKMFDHDDMGQHDYMGQVKLRLREDVLKGNEEKDPKMTKWFPLERLGNPSGKLHVELTWKHATKQLSVLLLAGKDLPKMDGLLLKADPYVVIKVEDQILPRLFTASDDCTARMWSIDAGTVEQGFVGHTRPITSIAVNKCFAETVLITSSIDTTVRMWNIKDGSVLRSFSHSAPVLCCALEIIPEKGVKRTVTAEQIFAPSEIRLHLELEFDVIANSKRLTINIVKARNIPMMDGDMAGGKADPFVVVSVGKVQHKGRVVRMNLNPEWNESFEFDDFEFDMDVVVRVYDWNAFGPPEYIGHVSVLLEALKFTRRRHEWFLIDHEPYSQVRLFTGGADQMVRMLDVRSGNTLQTYVGHKGAVTQLHLCDLVGKTQMISSSLDKTIKLWDLNFSGDSTKTATATGGRATGMTQQKPSKSWPSPAAINSFVPVVLEDKLRLFAGCQDSTAYMRSIDTSVATVSGGWRAKLSDFINSVAFSIFVLFLILVDISVGLYFDETINPRAQNIDCYGREPLAASLVTTVVLWIFSQEVFSQILLQGRYFFIPLSTNKLWSYLDIVIVAVSVGVAAYKVTFDYSQPVFDSEGLYMPPTLQLASDLGAKYCLLDVAAAGSGKETQKGATGFRAARVLGRIATGIRILRGVLKAASIAKRLGGLRGKKFVGHDRSITALKVMAPLDTKATSLRQRLRNVVTRDNLDTRELDAWRSVYESRWRLMSASSDCSVIMWDVMGTEIRVDPVKQFVDGEVDRMPIAELAV
mmetsp:Transcript_105491/g.169775  ORF Transcript_105491/g.169775 Transcript_105491/m.169775 type:complete len:948 (-) Transcript_105491:56-2899(-)